MMVGGKVPSTMSLEKAMILPSMPHGFVIETGSRLNPHSNQTWYGSPATTIRSSVLSSKGRKVRVSTRSFASGVVSVFSKLKIRGYAVRVWLPCCAAKTFVGVDGGDLLACGATAGPY